MKQPLQGGWRTIERHVELLTHDLYRHIDVSHTIEDIWNKISSLKGLRIAPIGHFVIGCTINVMKDRSWQTLLCKPPEITKVVTVC
jgi:hypothetical protein